MQDLQQAVSERDTLRIVRLLKELIPDYTPGSKLMKSVVAIESNHPESRVQVLTGQSEGDLSANIAASPRMH
jgi:hypothetical protein